MKQQVTVTKLGVTVWGALFKNKRPLSLGGFIYLQRVKEMGRLGGFRDGEVGGFTSKALSPQG